MDSMQNGKILLIGVNLAASVPLLIAGQAQAQSPGQSQATASSTLAETLKHVVADKAVAKSLDSTSQTPALKSPMHSGSLYGAGARSKSIEDLSAPRAMETRNTMGNAMGSIDGTKLRPFKANRRLPSAGDLAVQTPQLDNTTQASPLSGSVNQYYSPFAASGLSNIKDQARNRLKQAASAATRFEHKPASRVTANASPATPGQVGHPCAPTGVPNMSTSNNISSDALNEEQEMNSLANELNNDKQIFDGLHKQAALENAASASHAGPAPFPLNLIPEASLKQFLGGGHNAGAAHPSPASGLGAGSNASAMGAPASAPKQASYFGSWKQGQPSSGSNFANAHGHGNLAPSGFHTNINGSGGAKSFAKAYSPIAYRKGAKGKLATTVSQIKPSLNQSKGGSANARAQTRPSMSVATYGPYVSNPSL
jgi:hypothetical protein